MTIIYIHGIGRQHEAARLKLEWDLALFGRDMGDESRMAYWTDVLHGDLARDEGSAIKGKRVSKPDSANAKRVSSRGAESSVASSDPAAMEYEKRIWQRLGAGTGGGMQAKVLPLPDFLRKPISRAFLEAFIKDTAAYLFDAGLRARMQERLRAELKKVGGPVTVVAHSQGSIIAWDVLRSMKDAPEVREFVTIGSPLGIQEVQDHLGAELRVPACVGRWHNFADPIDVVAFDKGLADDFLPHGRIVDEIIINDEIRRLASANPHSAVGYLAHPKVRAVVQRAAGVDARARFLIARDVAAGMVSEERQSVLIEALEPGYPALGEATKTPPPAARSRRIEEEKPAEDDLRPVDRIVTALEEIVGKEHVLAARIDPLRHYVSARLTPSELTELAGRHAELRVYAVWKSVRRRKLLTRSQRVIQADAARTSYGATGRGVTWAVLDTGVRMDHPHFSSGTIAAVWDCTQRGAPTRIDDDRDADGHGTHVCGIIAGGSKKDAPALTGVAPEARLVVYKVLDDEGTGEDAWIIKALDHIAAQNERGAGIVIDGVNLSLGGAYDATVYGCGFSPICAELRRIWRAGTLVCVACGNEGQVEVSTLNGQVELNSMMSIGDPANLEDSIAVGSVHADRPNFYGISSFSSRGPTSDGRVKPDVVAPGERIRSCNAAYTSPADQYIEFSGTSMAAPHVSGMLAAFLSVRPEYRGRPDEVKALLLRTATDIGRDRYHQGHGVPNLMKMLLEG